MNREPLPTMGQDGLYPATDNSSDKSPLPSRPIILLLAITAALLLGVGYMLFANRPTPPPKHESASVAPRPAPSIAGKSEIQLKAELARINQEVTQARAERREMLKAIEQTSLELEQKLKEANLELSRR